MLPTCNAHKYCSNYLLVLPENKFTFAKLVCSVQAARAPVYGTVNCSSVHILILSHFIAFYQINKKNITFSMPVSSMALQIPLCSAQWLSVESGKKVQSNTFTFAPCTHVRVRVCARRSSARRWRGKSLGCTRRAGKGSSTEGRSSRPSTPSPSLPSSSKRLPHLQLAYLKTGRE